MTVVEMNIRGSKETVIGLDEIDCIQAYTYQCKIKPKLLLVSFKRRELTREEWYEYSRRSQNIGV